MLREVIEAVIRLLKTSDKGEDNGIRPHTTPLDSLPVAILDVSVLLPLLLCLPTPVFVRKWRKPALPYPPGPKGIPILGNVLDFSMSVPIWECLTSLSNSQGTFSSRSTLLILRLSLQRHGSPILTTFGQGHGNPEQQRGYF